MPLRSPRRAGGFTLLELLVVVAVVAIVAGLIVGPVTRSIESGQEVQSSGNLRQLTLANLAYASEHGTYVPAGDRQNDRRWHGTREAAGPFDATRGLLSPYLGRDGRVAPCPVLARMLAQQGRSFEEGSGGYGYNAVYLGGMRDSLADKSGLYIPPPTTRVSHPAATLMFAGTAYAVPGGVQEYPFAEPPFWDFGDGPTEFRPSPTLHFRFGGKALIGWCDGHISFVEREERAVGENPHGGDASGEDLGWFGPDKENGFWNPEREGP